MYFDYIEKIYHIEDKYCTNVEPGLEAAIFLSLSVGRPVSRPLKYR